MIHCLVVQNTLTDRFPVTICRSEDLANEIVAALNADYKTDELSSAECFSFDLVELVDAMPSMEDLRNMCTIFEKAES